MNLSNQGCFLLAVQRHQIRIVSVLVFVLIMTTGKVLMVIIIVIAFHFNHSKSGKVLSTSIQQLVCASPQETHWSSISL